MIRRIIVATAIAEKGYTEDPAGSNLTKYGAWYGLNGQPWCAIFVSWVYNNAGYPLGKIDTEKGFHYCPSAYNHWKNSGELTASPQEGDIILYDWKGNGFCEHTGIFIKWVIEGHSFQSLEGNTGFDNNSNGGEVMFRTRTVGVVQAFVSPKVLSRPLDVPVAENAMTLKPGTNGPGVIVLQTALNAKGTTPKLVTDGAFGNNTLLAVKSFQLKNNLDCDGIAGPETLAALGIISI